MLYYFKFDEDGKYKEVSEYEFYRNSISGFTSVNEIQSISQSGVSFYKGRKEIARVVGNVSDMKREV